MEEMRREGIPVGICSNAGQPASLVMQSMARRGFEQGVHYDFYMTSGEAARLGLSSETNPLYGKRYWVMGEPHPRYAVPHQAVFEGKGLIEVFHPEEADFFVCHIPNKEGSDLKEEEELDQLCSSYPELAHLKLPMLCLNPDEVVIEKAAEKPVFRQGALANRYAKLGGDVHHYGKPYTPIFQASMEQFRSFGIENPEEVWMVGDTPETDIRGGKAFGMHTALVTDTGLTAERVAQEGWDLFFQSLSALEKPDCGINALSWNGT
jgi:HAD superfamily hydrolase (TIGR01459 family)